MCVYVCVMLCAMGISIWCSLYITDMVCGCIHCVRCVCVCMHASVLVFGIIMSYGVCRVFYRVFYVCVVGL